MHILFFIKDAHSTELIMTTWQHDKKIIVVVLLFLTFRILKILYMFIIIHYC